MTASRQPGVAPGNFDGEEKCIYIRARSEFIHCIDVGPREKERRRERVPEFTMCRKFGWRCSDSEPERVLREIGRAHV